jgi:hypothetical protein
MSGTIPCPGCGLQLSPSPAAAACPRCGRHLAPAGGITTNPAPPQALPIPGDPPEPSQPAIWRGLAWLAVLGTLLIGGSLGALALFSREKPRLQGVAGGNSNPAKQGDYSGGDGKPTISEREASKLELDAFGNPKDEEAGLAGINEFAGKRILAWSGDPEVRQYIFTKDNPLWYGLRAKGFAVRIEQGSFQPAWLQEADQLWLFSGRVAHMDETGYQAVEAFVKAGKGLYLLSDNWPYVQESRVLARRLFGTDVLGNYLGTQIAYVRQRGMSQDQIRKYKGQYAVDDHPLLRGINFLYEGITISHVVPCDKMATAILASDGKILAATSKIPKYRVVIDCGWTRYYYGDTEEMRFITRTAGTARLGENVAAYLQGKEK